ncbi:13533_t:CDS:2 [Ambispora gerdemannii]|uniref:13533_t:CDS:1 n=1 Tax=Ambispora gerdemannii TaxID=144530 RepID=A0A9N8YUU9_9GLOM|nr:13533_t:CDS:2 [Ambispora gerdemannii]
MRSQAGPHSCLTCHVLSSSSPFNRFTPFLTKCCNRWVCNKCLQDNPRFFNYCPFCHRASDILSSSSRDVINNVNIESLNEESNQERELVALCKGSDDLPLYQEIFTDDDGNQTNLPTYDDVLRGLDSTEQQQQQDEKKQKLTNDEKSEYGVIHYVRKEDTLPGLAFKYGIGISDIRRANRLFDDNIFARTSLIIPNYFGPSLSEKQSKEDELKTLIKRFQLRSKCVDPTEAKYYMEQSNYNIDAATQAYRDDVLWEMQHPRQEKGIFGSRSRKSLDNQNLRKKKIE